MRFIHQRVDSDAIVEQYIEGRELYVGILGNQRLTTLPVWEMDFGTLPAVQAGIATRKVKWDLGYQKKHGIKTHRATQLGEAGTAGLARLTKRIYRALYMSGYARMDFRMTPDGRVYVLEANCNPNLSYGEDFSEAAAAGGVSYDALLHRIIRLGLSYEAEWRLDEA